MPDDEEDRHEPRRSNVVHDLGPYVSLLVLIIGGLGSMMYFVATTRTSAEQAQRDAIRLETEIHQTQVLIADGLSTVRKDIAILPDQRAKLEDVERRLIDIDRWRGVIEGRVSDIRDGQGELRSKVESIERASNVQLRPAR